MLPVDFLKAMPVHSFWVPRCFENLMDQKIAGAAMGCIKTIIHFLLYWIYCPYRCLYKRKLERIHHYGTNPVYLIDCTQHKVVGLSGSFLSLHNLKTHFNLLDQNQSCIQIQEGPNDGEYNLTFHPQNRQQVINVRQLAQQS